MARLDKVALAGSVTRAAVLASLAVIFSKRIPKQLKWFFVFLIALNMRNFPLRWHFRILGPWFWAIWKTDFKRRTHGPKGHLEYLTKISSIGKGPFGQDIVQVYRARAEVADCDYNLHLSNSAYAKNLDQCRMDACIQYFPGFSRLNGKMVLGGGYFQFLKEIPMHATFEIRFHISGWDEKWVYLTGAFISFPKNHHQHHRHHHGHTRDSRSRSDKLLSSAKEAIPPAIKEVAEEATRTIGESVVIVPPVTEGGFPETNSAIPSGVATPAEPSAANESSTTYDNIKALPIPESATLHAMSISQYCFKHGRVTVPPRVALILSGFGTPEKARERWDKLLAIRDDRQKMQDLMMGGWKSENGGGLGAGFWDFEFEEEGQRRGQELKRVRKVMDALAGK